MTVVDARGHRCPVPSLKLQKALQTALPGAQVTLLATDPMARIDVPFLMDQLRGQVLGVEENDGVLSITVVAPDDPPA
ncbi:MAG: sulfurtransferase TusA family protein [Brevundimonas sp.]|uniref:sulfurtransferase TusA family protein n=1 Tax=Brevundimonas sp. TaxID=1871086 RepID=UPI001A2ED570|nr:sulfurtransferase TusA family protein [Brevundimonas sp.]MBJ7445993.1 sulfurtransferase TusA family protein [Brevundimonas sp.]